MENKFNQISGDLGLNSVSYQILNKEASGRVYYRVNHDLGSLVFMSQGESIDDDDVNIESLEAFRKMGLGVPKVYKVFKDVGIVVQEDLGDIHLESIKDELLLDVYYKEAVKILLNMQIKAKEMENAGDVLAPFKRSFTADKFFSELQMTTDSYIEGYKGISLSTEKKKKLEFFYQELVSDMMKQPFLLQHRDYHSRNIMIKNGKLFLIDIQDSRQGPFTYDIASLTIDPYIELDEGIINNSINSYYEGIKKLLNCSYDDFIKFYRLCYLQRGIKVLGTFAFQKIKKDNNKYLKYIPITLEKIRSVAVHFPVWEKQIVEDILG